MSKRSADIYFGDLDTRGIVNPSHRTSSTRAHGNACDIVIPAYNALDALDHCLTSVRTHTSPPFRVIVVDDASDERVACYLRAVAATDERVELLRNERNLGFVRTANRGLSATTAPFACLLNSDTIVTPGWLEALIRCARSDPRIAVVNPTSNAAVNLSVQMAPGLNMFTMAEAVAARSRRVYPDVVTAVGFCLLITRAALERFGAFDEIYGDGYCEESDYCMRITTGGGRTVVADDANEFIRLLIGRRIPDAHRQPVITEPKLARHLANVRRVIVWRSQVDHGLYSETGEHRDAAVVRLRASSVGFVQPSKQRQCRANFGTIFGN